MNPNATRLPDPQDTIVALSSAPGAGGRAIVRLSGPKAIPIAETVFKVPPPLPATSRGWGSGVISLPAIHSPLPTALHVWPAPRTYTGQNLAELHTLASPPLVELLIAQLLNAGARAAQPGEFTMRAFLAGKLDLPRAEAVLGVIEATSQDELKQALTQLAGGVTQPLHGLREDLLNLLADVEAALDFADEEIQFVTETDLLTRLAKGLALLTNLRRQLEQRAVTGRVFRVALAGRPNAGKSSLFNALAGAPTALVSPEPGTTRDYLVKRLSLDELTIELVDTAGWQPATGAVEQQAQALGRAQAEQADLVLLCVEASQRPTAEETALLTRTDVPGVVAVATKCDRATPLHHALATSAVTGAGLDALQALLAERACAQRPSALAPSLSRCRHHVEACLQHLRQAHQVVIFQEPPELLALALREALDELGALVGAVWNEDLLDRIFSRFCIGK
jgi:tRNA modification GTPase